MKKNFILAAIAIGIFGVGSNAAHAQAIPTSANLSTSYSGETGVLRIVSRYNRAPSRPCTMRIRGSVSYEGQATAESIRTVYQKKIKSRRVDFRVTGLNAVPLDGDGNRPQLNLQATLTCPSGRVVSDAEAVFVVCGRGTSEVTPTTFLRQLSKKISDVD